MLKIFLFIYFCSNGEVKVTLQDQKNNIPVKKSVGSEEKTNGTSGQGNQKKETTTQNNGDSTESVPPLQPPPQPVFSRAYDDEDFDLYADIETPVDPPYVIVFNLANSFIFLLRKIKISD